MSTLDLEQSLKEKSMAMMSEKEMLEGTKEALLFNQQVLEQLIERSIREDCETRLRQAIGQIKAARTILKGIQF